MRPEMVAGFLVGIVIPFSALAGVMAFLITYHEYRRHYPDARPARRAAIRAGIVATLFFLAFSVAAGFATWHFTSTWVLR